MGEMYKASCPGCGFETTLYLGAGLLSINLRRCASILPEEERTVLLRMADNNEINEFSVDNKVIECPGCGKFDSQMIIDVTKQDGTTYRFGKLCHTCNKQVIIHEDGAGKMYKCPNCGRHILELEETGMWD